MTIIGLRDDGDFHGFAPQILPLRSNGYQLPSLSLILGRNGNCLGAKAHIGHQLQLQWLLFQCQEELCLKLTEMLHLT